MAYLSVFSPNTGKYGPEKNLYLDTFHAVTSPYQGKTMHIWSTYLFKVIKILKQYVQHV